MRRRNFIKCLAGGVGLGLYGCNELIKQNIISSIDHESSPLNFHVVFNLYGAPARWNFDNPLDPYGNNYIRHPFISSGFSKRSTEETTYELKQINGLHLPPVWHQEYRGKRKNAAYSDLAKNMNIVRGVDVINSGHAPANRRLNPLVNGTTLNGRFKVDQNANNYAVITGLSPANQQYASNNGVERIELDAPIYYGDTFKALRPGHLDKGIEDSILRNLKILSKSGVKSDKIRELYRSRINLISKVKEQQRALYSDYPAIYRKYKEIADDILHATLSGEHLRSVFARKVPGYSGRGKEKKFKAHGLTLTVPDIRSCFKSVNMDYWVHQFALSEFLIKNGLARSLNLSTPMAGSYFQDFDFSGNTNTDGSKTKRALDLIKFDSHGLGSIPDLMTSSLFYSIFLGCLHELVAELKDHDLFDQTLIQVTSEYDRIPRDNLGGSDHNPRGHISSFYSGAIREPYILGNTKIRSQESKIISTYNEGAIVNSLKRRLDFMDLNNSLSAILCPNFKISGNSIYRLENNIITPQIERGKNV